MRSITRLLVLVLAFPCIVEGGRPVAADEPQLKIRYGKIPGTRISGRENPESVPYVVKYQTFIRNYRQLFSAAIVQDLSRHDDAILADASAMLSHFDEADQAERDREFVELCSKRGSMPLGDVAREVDRIFDESTRRRENFFRNAVSRLSENGRSKVIHFVDSVIASRTNILIPISALESFKEDELEFEYWIDTECHRALTGEYPAELQERMKQVEQYLKGSDPSKIEGE